MDELRLVDESDARTPARREGSLEAGGSPAMLQKASPRPEEERGESRAPRARLRVRFGGQVGLPASPSASAVGPARHAAWRAGNLQPSG